MDLAEFCLSNHLSGDDSPTLRFCKICRKAMCEKCYDSHKSVCDIYFRHSESANRDTVVQFTGMTSSQKLKDTRIPQDTSMLPSQSVLDLSIPQIKHMETGASSDRSFYQKCAVHSLSMDQFCRSHCSVICRRCQCENHKYCSVNSVEQACLELDITSVSEFRKSLNKIRVDSIEVKTLLSKNVISLEKQRQSVLKEIKNVYESVLSQLNREFENTKSEVERQHEKHTSEICANICHLNGILASIELSLTDAKILECRNIDAGLFLNFQEILCRNIQLPNDVQDLYNKIRKIKIAFRGHKRFQPLMARSRIGSINVTTTKYTSLSPHREISCSLFVSQPVCIGGGKSETAIKMSSLENSGNANQRSVVVVYNQTYQDVKVKEVGDLSVRCADDFNDNCCITGIDVTGDGRIMVVDNKNKNIKMFTADRISLLHLPLIDLCYDITVFNDTTAIAAGVVGSLYFIDISGTSLCVKNTVNVDYSIIGIQACGNNLLVTCNKCPRSVKLITVTGEELWSVSKDQRGSELFVMPSYITCYRDQSRCRVVVTDLNRDIITLLNGDTGDVIKSIEVKGKEPHGVTTDRNGNFYVCYSGSGEIVVWNRDMTTSRVLLSSTRHYPYALGYDAFRNQLIISFLIGDTAKCYQLS